MSLTTVILAAGQGKRMCSSLPKVLHKIAGVALLEHVVNTSQVVNPGQLPIVIYGHAGAQVRAALGHLGVTWVEQTAQLGTGHALLQALPHLPKQGRILILYGDVPLITAATLVKMLTATPHTALGMLTAQLPDPHGFGRIVRDAHGAVSQVIEDKDADAVTRAIQEVNSGIYLVPADFLHKALPALTNHNAQQEYYLTDIITQATQQGVPIHALPPAAVEEVLGVNDRLQLAHLERYYQRQTAERLMRQGVTLYDPARLDVRGELNVGADTSIDVNVIIEGQVSIGQHCTIGPHVLLRNAVIGDHVTVHAHSVIDGADIAAHCTIGPFARLRPGTRLMAHCHVGNFVEVKNSDIGTGSKVNHLAYVGDSDVGRMVNIGAGAITCNYDGANKHRTRIGDHVFVGSNTSLIAPLTIGAGATIGAGSIISRDAPAAQLTIARAPQKSIANWRRPEKNEEA